MSSSLARQIDVAVIREYGVTERESVTANGLYGVFVDVRYSFFLFDQSVSREKQAPVVKTTGADSWEEHASNTATEAWSW